MLGIVIQEVLWSIRGSYSAIWSLPLTNVKWHSDLWQTVTSQPIRLFTNSMTLIPSLTLHRIMSGFHGRVLVTRPDTWFRPPVWNLLVLQLLRPDSSFLPCPYSTFIFTLDTPWYFLGFALYTLITHLNASELCVPPTFCRSRSMWCFPIQHYLWHGGAVYELS